MKQSRPKSIVSKKSKQPKTARSKLKLNLRTLSQVFYREFSEKEMPRKVTLKATGLISLGGQGNEIKMIPRRKVSISDKKRLLKV